MIPGLVSAQSSAREKPVLPPGPLCQKRAPDKAHWTITSLVPASTTLTAEAEGKAGESGTDAQKAPGLEDKKARTRVTVVKYGDLVHVMREDELKQRWSTWIRGALQVAVWPDQQNVEYAAPPPNPDVINPIYFDFSQTDFPGFGWLSAANFSDIAGFRGRKCLVFRERFAPPVVMTVGEDPAAPVPQPVVQNMTAYIDLETRFPVALENAEGIQTYQFHAPPQDLALPGNVKTLFEDRDRLIQKTAKKANVKPF